MKTYFFLFFLAFSSFLSFGQVDQQNPCDWLNVLETLKKKSYQLNLAKAYYVSFDSVLQHKTEDRCKVLYTVQINDSRFVLSSFTSKNIRNPRAILETIQADEIDTIRLLDRAASKLLYDAEAIVQIISSNTQLEKRIDSIRHK